MALFAWCRRPLFRDSVTFKFGTLLRCARSIVPLSKRKAELSGRISDVSNEEYVGSFGVSITLTPIKRLKGKRRQPVATAGTFDEYVQ